MPTALRNPRTSWFSYLLCHLVKLFFNKLKNAHRFATGYDKTAKRTLGFIDITSLRF